MPCPRERSKEVWARNDVGLLIRFDMELGLEYIDRLGCCECSCESDGMMDEAPGEEYDGRSMSIRYGNVGLPPIWLEFAPSAAGADCRPWDVSSSRGRFAVLLIGTPRVADVIEDVCRSPEIGMVADECDEGDKRIFDR